jgi:hypothetical protein
MPPTLRYMSYYALLYGFWERQVHRANFSRSTSIT